ncbi:MAG: DUF302 domain-containing protein [Mariprofundaceae bacterium]|nr:DUF302 domain-containing protein [Mariprofundaceae bacterium]
MSDYGLRIDFDGDMEAAELAITDALKEEGFGIITRIDIAATLKKKIDLERLPYVILGACNPRIAGEALEAEEELGLLLPCNVIVYRSRAGKTVISAINPENMLSIVDNTAMQAMADQVKVILQRALDTCHTSVNS